MKKLITILTICILLAGCTPTQPDIQSESFNVYSLKGPTSMSLVKLLKDNEEGKSFNKYNSTIVTGADEVTAALINGNADIAMLPANAAATLFNKKGGFKVVAINTLGVLYIVETEDSIKSISDLKGKTVYLTGKGTTPEYALRYLLQYYNIENDVTLEFRSEATEVVNELAKKDGGIGLLPQPFVTSVLMQNEDFKIALNLSDEFKTISADTPLVTGVTVVRDEVLQNYPEQIQKFLEEYNASAQWTINNIDEAAQLIVDIGIVGNAKIAQQALPLCSIVCITGKEMKNYLSAYLNTLNNFNPASIGGQMPSDSFYYE